MSNKVFLMGLITLLVFPICGFLLRFGIDLSQIDNFLGFQSFDWLPIGLGLEFGFVYAFVALLFMRAEVFSTSNLKMERLIKGLNLNFWQGIFLSLCAGIGEELFFRMSLQPFLGIWITSIVFVAIHGYLNPLDWKFSLYGLIALPFIVILSYGYERFGIHFAIAAHFCYDAVLFTAMLEDKKTI